MGFSQVDICNLSLSRAGGNSILQITSLGEASTEARQCAIKFPHVLRSALRAYPWNFATKTVALALVGTNELQKFYENIYYYQYPEDCLQILAINTPLDLQSITQNQALMSFPYSVELGADGTKFILTPCPQALLRFITYIDDPSIWDSLFCDAFAWQLASELCMSLGGDNGRVQALKDLASLAFDKAKSQDSKEGQYVIVNSNYLGARK